MGKIEFIFGVLECLFDIFTVVCSNIRVIIEKRREYIEKMGQEKK